MLDLQPLGSTNSGPWVLGMGLQEGVRILVGATSRGRILDGDELTLPDSRLGRFSVAGMESALLFLSAEGVCRPGYMG